MLYSRHQLDKIGQALLETGDPFSITEARAKISKWRETHLPVLNNLNDQLQAFFAEHKVKHEFSSMRIKRMTSIEAKLKNNAEKHTKLGGLQDIGGIRYVFSTIDELDNVISLLKEFHPKDFEQEIRMKDYVEKPKESGYRSTHFIYKFISDDPVYNGLSIELQVRTQLQHAWAMAVETASLISKTTLKADIDDAKEWRGFFKLVSALFAREEKKPVHETFKDYTFKDFCLTYHKYEEAHNFVDKLMALRTTVNADLKGDDKGFCVLAIDFEQKTVRYTTFNQEDSEAATQLFNDLEKNLTSEQAALMVAIEKMNELKQAYPSYFLDSQQFIIALARFTNSCKTASYF